MPFNSTKPFIIAGLCLPMLSNAALLDIADSPLFLGTSINPNVFFELDDSGSMDWEFLTPQHWHYCSYDSHADGGYSATTTCGWLVENGLLRSFGNGSYRYFTYLYENNDNVYSDSCSSSERNSIEACSSAGDKDWRATSSSLNFIYYDPNSTYAPWNGPCYSSGTICGQASFSTAKSNPREGESGYAYTKNLVGSAYHIWIDDKGFDSNDGRPLRSNDINVTTGANNMVDLWDSHVKITINSANATVHSITYTPDTTGLNTAETLEATLSGSACYNALGSESLVQNIFAGNLAYDSTNSPGCRTLQEAQNNFANWYEYGRKRSYVAKSAISRVISDYPYFRYGLSVLNNYNSLFTEIPASTVSDTTSHNSQLLANLYSFNWSAYGTPLRRGLERAGKYYDGALSGKTDPIVHSCQQNFTIMITDGFWNGSSPSSSIGDADGDGHSATVADVAKYYYDKDLSGLSNQVITNAFDPATHQHMVTFSVAFGVTGNLMDTDDDGWPNPVLSESSNWGDPFSGDPEKIDDLWHAAYNSKGKFVAAQTPSEVSNQLANALANVSDRVSSAATVAQNSTVLNTNSQIYQARFDSNDWSGELLAYGIDTLGNVASIPNWNASCLLTGGICQLPTLSAAQNPGKDPSYRLIFTKAAALNQGVEFVWPSNYQDLKVGGSFATRYENLMQHAPYSINTVDAAEIAANQAYGEKLIAYIRGVRSQEQQNGGSEAFRNRTSVLGDIIHSDPLYVGPPNRYYPDTLEASPYSTYKQTYSGRTPVVYTGTNQGMLHGFNASTGEELIAYVPADRRIYDNLAHSSQSSYQHQYGVDGSATEGDVYINSTWKNILVAGLKAGGQTVFALDITDPSQYTTANTTNLLLWEFSDQDDPDLGYTFSNISIVKVKSGPTSTKWAAIFGNGLNNAENDGYTSTTGKAALFVLFIENGLDGQWTVDTDYIKIPVGTGTPTTPSGITGIYPIDIDGDYVVDYVYAGDIDGNLWRFDLTDTTPTNWKNNAFKLFSALDTTAGDQAITSPPIVNTHPLGISQGVLVYFGTGKYIEPTDNDTSSQATQSFYAIWDQFSSTPVSKSQLLTQTINGEYSLNYDLDGDTLIDTTVEVRDISNNAINWLAPVNPGDPAQHLGWHLDLFVSGSGSNDGERQITRALLRNGNVIFTTLLPSVSPCEFGGESWIMELNAENGGRPNAAPFDVNQDGIFDVLDYINLGDTNGDGIDETVPPGGQKSSVGVAPTPAVFLSSDKQSETKVMSGSRGLDTFSENPETGPSGRQTWRQIR